MCKVFPSVTDALSFNTIFPLKLLYQLEAVYYEHGEVSPMSSTNGFLKTIINKTIILTQTSVHTRMAQTFVSWRPEQWMWRTEASQRSLTSDLFKIIFPRNLLHWLKFIYHETWTMNLQTSGILSNAWPFQDHFATKTIIACWSCLLREWLKALSPSSPEQ